MWPIRQVLVFALLWLPVASVAVGDEPARRTDAYGDPLPDGARLRLGSRSAYRSPANLGRLAVAGRQDLAVPGTHGSVRFWDVASGRMLRELKGKGIVRGLRLFARWPIPRRIRLRRLSAIARRETGKYRTGVPTNPSTSSPGPIAFSG